MTLYICLQSLNSQTLQGFTDFQIIISNSTPNFQNFVAFPMDRHDVTCRWHVLYAMLTLWSYPGKPPPNVAAMTSCICLSSFSHCKICKSTTCTWQHSAHINLFFSSAWNNHQQCSLIVVFIKWLLDHEHFIFLFIWKVDVYFRFCAESGTTGV